MVTWTQAVGGPPPHPAAWLAVSRAPNPRPPPPSAPCPGPQSCGSRDRTPQTASRASTASPAVPASAAARTRRPRRRRRRAGWVAAGGVSVARGGRTLPRLAEIPPQSARPQSTVRRGRRLPALPRWPRAAPPARAASASLAPRTGQVTRVPPEEASHPSPLPSHHGKRVSRTKPPAAEALGQVASSCQRTFVSPVAQRQLGFYSSQITSTLDDLSGILQAGLRHLVPLLLVGRRGPPGRDSSLSVPSPAGLAHGPLQSADRPPPCEMSD